MSNFNARAAAGGSGGALTDGAARISAAMAQTTADANKAAIDTLTPQVIDTANITSDDAAKTITFPLNSGGSEVVDISGMFTAGGSSAAATTFSDATAALGANNVQAALDILAAAVAAQTTALATEIASTDGEQGAQDLAIAANTNHRGDAAVHMSAAEKAQLHDHVNNAILDAISQHGGLSFDDAGAVKLVLTRPDGTTQDVSLPLVDDLTTGGSKAFLSAQQGVLLRNLIEGIGERKKVEDNAEMAADPAPNGQTFYVVDDGGTGKWRLYQRIGGADEPILGQDDLASAILEIADTTILPADTDYNTPGLIDVAGLDQYTLARRQWIDFSADNTPMVIGKRYRGTGGSVDLPATREDGSPLQTGDSFTLMNAQSIVGGANIPVNGSVLLPVSILPSTEFGVQPSLIREFVWNGTVFEIEAERPLLLSVSATSASGSTLLDGHVYSITSGNPGNIFKLEPRAGGFLDIRLTTNSTDTITIEQADMSSPDRDFILEDNGTAQSFDIPIEYKNYLVRIEGDVSVNKWRIYRPWEIEPLFPQSLLLNYIEVGMRSSGTNAASRVDLTFVDVDGNNYPPGDWAYSADLTQYAGGSATLVTDKALWTGGLTIGHNKDGTVKFYYTGDFPNGLSAIIATESDGGVAQDVTITYQGTNYNDAFAAVTDITNPIYWTTSRIETANDAAAVWSTDVEYVDAENVAFTFTAPATNAAGDLVTSDGTTLIPGQSYILIYDANRAAADSVAALADDAATIAEVALMRFVGKVEPPAIALGYLRAVDSVVSHPALIPSSGPGNSRFMYQGVTTSSIMQFDASGNNPVNVTDPAAADWADGVRVLDLATGDVYQYNRGTNRFSALTESTLDIVRYTADGPIEDRDHRAIFETGAVNMTLSASTTDRLIQMVSEGPATVITANGAEQFTGSLGTSTDSKLTLNDTFKWATIIGRTSGGWSQYVGQVGIPEGVNISTPTKSKEETRLVQNGIAAASGVTFPEAFKAGTIPTIKAIAQATGDNVNVTLQNVTNTGFSSWVVRNESDVGIGSPTIHWEATGEPA